MPNNTERTVPEGTPPNSRQDSAPENKPETQSNSVTGPSNEEPGSIITPPEALTQAFEKNRLPLGVKEQILAELPPPQEHERVYRELRNNGGLSSDEFFASVGLGVPPQS